MARTVDPTADPTVGLPEARPFDDSDDLVVVSREPRPGLGGPLLLALALLLVAAVAGVASVASDDGGARAATVRWSAETPSAAGPALVAGDLVIVGQDQGALDQRPARLTAFDDDTGEEVWRADLESPAVTPVALTGDGEAVVVRTTRQVAVLDVETGAARWRHSYAAGRPDPVMAGDALLVGGERLMAADLDDGDVVWRSDLGSAHEPVVADGTVYVTAEEALAAVELDGGEQRWVSRLDESSRFAAPPVVTEDLVVAGSNDGEVLAVARSDGRRVWSVRTDPGDPVTALLGTAGESVLVAGESGRVYSFDLATGERRWAVDTAGEMADAGDAALVDGVLVVGAAPSRHVVALDADSGEPRWSEEVGAIAVPPLVVDGEVVTGVLGPAGRTGRIVALDLADGDPAWDVTLPHPPRQRMTGLGDDGVLVTSGVAGQETGLLTLLR